MKIEIAGLDKLQRQFDELAKAASALDGEITKLSFDPHDPGSVDAAIQQMEEAIDARVEPYCDNPMVETIVGQMKDKYRTAIFERIEVARLNADNS